MKPESRLISTGTLTRQSMAGQIVIVTGAGGGIGFETARALAWLGAKVILAEINSRKGRQAQAQLRAEFDPQCCEFIRTDVGDEGSVRRLALHVIKKYGQVDAVLNNATLTPMGAVCDVPIAQWDTSYRVNLRGPVLLARAFLPAMLKRGSGAFVCVSSVGDQYMSAYETLKSAQVHLARALDAELEGSGVSAFTMGPGLVLTETAVDQISRLAPMYGKSVEEFYAMSAEHMLSVEAAGAGFAAALALAAQFRGLEIDTRMALNAAGISLPEAPGETTSLSEEEFQTAARLCRELRQTLQEQASGWAQRPLFERQWMLRDFKQYANQSVDQCLADLADLQTALDQRDPRLPGRQAPANLSAYFEHYAELARNHVKDPQEREEQLQTISTWQKNAEKLARLL